ncbi:MAG: rhodanese-related sulfurtransferase [Saccharospirillaceae bacterium]|nr:rhodanese-related sulfurtransferase [Pseudomonadales bacterium]NRB80911.1 rhodanese-related sulfurtransferase [Saccharospirillaceae bacterium]
MSKQNIVVCALYHFVTLEDYQQIQPNLLKLLNDHEIRGTLLLAKEGINGTVAGTRESMDVFLNWLKSDPRFAPTVFKESYVDEMPFLRSRVKLKKEIVTMGVEGIDPKHIVGTYVKPDHWNDLISQDDVLLVDTRNEYETQIGSFKGAIDPKTETFREFPEFVKQNFDPKKHKKVAMFCTGGIRCEKSTAYMKEQGFDEVYHLEGGILKYLEEVPKTDTMWEGECFVFDGRVSVNHDLEKGIYDQCHACRRPIIEADKLRAEYKKGVSCHQCIDKTTPEQIERFAQREKQMELAKARGETHIGQDYNKVMNARREEKLAKKNEQRKSAK